MIWNDTESPAALRNYLDGEISRRSPGLHPEVCADLADVLAVYCEGQDRAGRLPADYLSFLVDRSLAAIGEQTQDPDSPALAARILRESGWGQEVSLPVWNLLQSGLIRPVRSDLAGGGACWTLDFTRLRERDDRCLELALMPAIQLLLRRVADVWDADRGRGVLELKGLARLPVVREGAGWRSRSPVPAY